MPKAHLIGTPPTTFTVIAPSSQGLEQSDPLLGAALGGLRCRRFPCTPATHSADAPDGAFAPLDGGAVRGVVGDADRVVIVDVTAYIGSGLFSGAQRGTNTRPMKGAKILSTEIASLVGQLIETIENGQLGLAEAATRLAEHGHPEMSSAFLKLSNERKGFRDQLRVLVGAADEAANTDGTTAGRLHRGFIAITDAITGDNPIALLKNVVEGEAHAISEYEHTLEADLAAELRQAIELQLVSVKTSHKLADALLTQSQAPELA